MSVFFSNTYSVLSVLTRSMCVCYGFLFLCFHIAFEYKSFVACNCNLQNILSVTTNYVLSCLQRCCQLKGYLSLRTQYIKACFQDSDFVPICLIFPIAENKACQLISFIWFRMQIPASDLVHKIAVSRMALESHVSCTDGLILRWNINWCWLQYECIMCVKFCSFTILMNIGNSTSSYLSQFRWIKIKA